MIGFCLLVIENLLQVIRFQSIEFQFPKAELLINRSPFCIVISLTDFDIEFLE